MGAVTSGGSAPNSEPASVKVFCLRHSHVCLRLGHGHGIVQAGWTMRSGTALDFFEHSPVECPHVHDTEVVQDK